MNIKEEDKDQQPYGYEYKVCIVFKNYPKKSHSHFTLFSMIAEYHKMYNFVRKKHPWNWNSNDDLFFHFVVEKWDFFIAIFKHCTKWYPSYYLLVVVLSWVWYILVVFWIFHDKGIIYVMCFRWIMRVMHMVTERPPLMAALKASTKWSCQMEECKPSSIMQITLDFTHKLFTLNSPQILVSTNQSNYF